MTEISVRKNRRIYSTLKIIKDIKQLKIGLSFLLILIFIAVFGPDMAPHDPHILGEQLLAHPGRDYFLGTDSMGRDVFSMILYGTRTSLLVGVVAAAIAGFVGTFIGGIAGYFGGKVDQILSEFINIFLMVPAFFLILLVIAIFGSNLFNVMVVIGFTTWTGNALLMRVQAKTLRERVFVKSAIAMGETKSQILIRHIIPNGIFPIIANTTMNISGAILTEAGLSFLGLGDPNAISYGQIVYQGKAYLISGWWVSTFSGLAIVAMVIVFYIIGDGLNQVLSPKLRTRK